MRRMNTAAFHHGSQVASPGPRGAVKCEGHPRVGLCPGQVGGAAGCMLDEVLVGGT